MSIQHCRAVVSTQKAEAIKNNGNKLLPIKYLLCSRHITCVEI